MMKLYLNSNNSSNNTYTLDKSIDGKWKLISFAFTNNIYNVNDTNNKIYFNENGTDLVATLTNGYNDTSDLTSNISTSMNNVSSGTITVTFDDKTRKFTITDTLPIFFTFGTNTTNSARKLLGYNASDGTSSATSTSDNAIDLNPYKEIFVNIEENDDRDIMGVNYFNTSLVICGCGANGEMMRYNYRDFTHQYMKFKRTKKLTVRIHDLNNNDINLNSEYSIMLEKLPSTIINSICSSCG